MANTTHTVLAIKYRNTPCPRNRLITWTGGIPIFDGQDCVGGIGVSGAMDHQDLECADAALKSVGLKDAPNNMAEH